MGIKIAIGRKYVYPGHGEQQHHTFNCPGCETTHSFHVPRWTFTGTVECPTYVPSLVTWYNDPRTGEEKCRCHSFVREGRIEFLGDCYHALKGKTVEIPDWDPEKFKYYDAKAMRAAGLVNAEEGANE